MHTFHNGYRSFYCIRECWPLSPPGTDYVLKRHFQPWGWTEEGLCFRNFLVHLSSVDRRMSMVQGNRTHLPNLETPASEGASEPVNQESGTLVQPPSTVVILNKKPLKSILQHLPASSNLSISTKIMNDGRKRQMDLTVWKSPTPLKDLSNTFQLVKIEHLHEDWGRWWKWPLDHMVRKSYTSYVWPNPIITLCKVDYFWNFGITLCILRQLGLSIPLGFLKFAINMINDNKQQKEKSLWKARNCKASNPSRKTREWHWWLCVTTNEGYTFSTLSSTLLSSSLWNLFVISL